MSFTVIFHPDAAKEIARLNEDLKQRIKTAITERLMTEPALYGKPLRATLKGYWKLRVGDYRLVFSVYDTEIIVFAVCHRKEVYDLIHRRM